tara:strand:- start:1585 stop:2214 length:630 start_codon:yes stop_codon:yes gene_type:complete
MIGAIMGAVGGLTKIAGGIIGSGKRKAEARDAKAELANRKDTFEQADTSNVYAGMENTMEDLTVNTQAAEFQSQQQQQGMANIMDTMGASAGGSGIASLAQSMANQQNQNLQKSVIDIGKQEQSNQTLERQQAGKNQLYEAKGELISRDAESEKNDTLLGMAQQRSAAANEAVEASKQAIIGGVGDIAGSATKMIPGVGALGSMIPGGK